MARGRPWPSALRVACRSSSLESQPMAPISAYVARAASSRGAASSSRRWVTSQRASSSCAWAWNPTAPKAARASTPARSSVSASRGSSPWAAAEEAAEAAPLGGRRRVSVVRAGQWSPGRGGARRARDPRRPGRPGPEGARAGRSRRRCRKPRAGVPAPTARDGSLRRGRRRRRLEPRRRCVATPGRTPIRFRLRASVPGPDPRMLRRARPRSCTRSRASPDRW